MDQTRHIGQHILIERVALDPFGSLHRAVKLTGDGYDRHALARSYNGEVLRGQGFDQRLHQASWVIHDLPREWSCGRRWRLDESVEPLLSCDYAPGLTLASVLRKVARARTFLPVPFVLSVLQQVAVGVHFLRQQQVGFGILSPHLVWLGFDGSAHLLDAPMAPFLAESLARLPEARMTLLPFLGLGIEEPERRDLFQLGALALTALTLTPPSGYRTLLHEGVPALWPHSSQFPEAMRLLVARLLGLETPYQEVSAGVRAIDALAFDPAFECGAVERALHLRRAFPESYRLQTRDWKWEARLDWSKYFRLNKRQLGHAPRGEAKGRGLLAGVTG